MLPFHDDCREQHRGGKQTGIRLASKPEKLLAAHPGLMVI
jgi:hypothetical protein